MATIARPTLTIGGTSFTQGYIPTTDEWNDEFDNIYNEFNGGIDGDNIDTTYAQSIAFLGEDESVTGYWTYTASASFQDGLSATDVSATNLGGTLFTAAQPNVTSVGTLTSLEISGDLTVATDLIYVDSANESVGFGNTNPATLASGSAKELVIGSWTGAHAMSIICANNEKGSIFFGRQDDNDEGRFRYDHSDSKFKFYKNSNLYFSAGIDGFVFNNEGQDADFRIQSDLYDDSFFVQGSDGHVGFGTDTPTTAQIEILHPEQTTEGIRIIQTTAGRTTASKPLAFFYDDQAATTQDTVVITNNGTGNILKCNDGASAVLVVADGGNMGFNTADIESWNSGYNALQLGDLGIMYRGFNDSYWLANAYNDGVNEKYRGSTYASKMEHNGGNILFAVADTGAADDPITWINSLYLDVTGNAGIRTTTFDGTAVGYLAIANGTEPAAHTDNQIYIGAKDGSTDSESTLALFLESDPVVVGTFTASHKVYVWINGVEYAIQLDQV